MDDFRDEQRVSGPDNESWEHRNDGHPVESQSYLLLTPAIERLAEQMSEWIDYRFSGAIVFGDQRIGKTRAIRALIEPKIGTFWN
jgi:hypothetical protein